MEKQRQETEFERKGRLIEEILDDVLPFTDEMAPAQVEQREIDRQVYVLESGLGNMSADEVQHIILEHMYYGLPAVEP